MVPPAAHGNHLPEDDYPNQTISIDRLLLQCQTCLKRLACAQQPKYNTIGVPCVLHEPLNREANFACVAPNQVLSSISAKGFRQPDALLDSLSQGSNCPLTLVCAPAGYGKSLLMSSFLQSCALPWAWLSLDESDNDLRLFLDYFVAALGSLFPGALRSTQLLLAGTSLPPVSVIADGLINELAELDSAFILALDDLHVINAADIHSLLDALLRHPQPGLHLMLLTCQDPPVGLGRLRARGQVSEIRARDSAFHADRDGGIHGPCRHPPGRRSTCGAGRAD